MKRVKLYVIVGLAGSGKTTLANKFVNKKYIFDEQLLAEDDPKVWNDLIRELRAGNNCVAGDKKLCCKKERPKFVSVLKKAVPDVEIEWHYFENNLKKANKNCLNRKKDPEGHFKMNIQLFEDYDVPAPSDPYSGKIHNIIVKT